jgi:hypothetical protein
MLRVAHRGEFRNVKNIGQKISEQGTTCGADAYTRGNFQDLLYKYIIDM